MILREPGCLDAKVVCSSYLTGLLVLSTLHRITSMVTVIRNVVVGTVIIIQRTLLESPIPSAERCPSKAYGQELNMRLAALIFQSYVWPTYAFVGCGEGCRSILEIHRWLFVSVKTAVSTVPLTVKSTGSLVLPKRHGTKPFFGCGAQLKRGSALM